MIVMAMLLAAGVQVNCDGEVSQGEMNECAYQDFQAADAKLNAEWKLAVARVKARDRESGDQPSEYDTLLAAQRAWLTYRDRHCQGEGFGMRRSAAEPRIVDSCKLKLTQARIDQLRGIGEE